MLYVILDCKLNLWWKKKGDIQVILYYLDFWMGLQSSCQYLMFGRWVQMKWEGFGRLQNLLILFFMVFIYVVFDFGFVFLLFIFFMFFNFGKLGFINCYFFCIIIVYQIVLIVCFFGFGFGFLLYIFFLFLMIVYLIFNILKYEKKNVFLCLY